MRNTNDLQQSKNSHSSEGPNGRVLVVDDDPELLAIMSRYVEQNGYSVSAHDDANSARAWFQQHSDEVDIILTDLCLPDSDGLQLMREMREANPTLVGILITGYGSVPNAVRAIRSGAVDFVTKPANGFVIAVALERAMQQRLNLLEKQRTQEEIASMAEQRGVELAKALSHLEDAYQFMLESLVSMLEARERPAGEHTRRVTEISLILAKALGLRDDDLLIVRRGASLHDIGKVAIPDAILHKPGPLDTDEWKIMKTHVDVGYSILKSNPYLREVAELVYSHHEHFDGRGYPRGLKGDEICFGARIFSVADAYDAIRARRPYSPAHSAIETIGRITKDSGTQFDPSVVQTLLRCQNEIDATWQRASAAESHNFTNEGNIP